MLNLNPTSKYFSSYFSIFTTHLSTFGFIVTLLNPFSKISPISAIKQSKSSNVTILSPVVHLLGDDAASIGYVKVTQTLDKWVFVCQHQDCYDVCVQTRSRLHLPGRGDAGVAEKGGTLVQCSLPPEQLDMQQPICRQKLLGGNFWKLTTNTFTIIFLFQIHWISLFIQILT